MPIRASCMKMLHIAYVGVLAYTLRPRHGSQVEKAVVGSARTRTVVFIEDHP